MNSKPKCEAVYVYVGGYGRSGSTLIDSYLSSDAQVAGLGEVSHIFDEVARDADCACGERLAACSLWSPVVAKLSNQGASELGLSNKRVEGLFGIPSGSDKAAYDNFWSDLLAAIYQDHDVAIDSSKSTRETFFRYLKIRKLVPRSVYLYVCKDPESLVFSLKKGSNKFLDGRDDGQPYSYWFLTRSFIGWVLANISSLLTLYLSRDDSLLVDYEKFCEDPTLLSKQLQGLGVQVAESEEISPGHGVSGNRVRSHLKRVEVRVPTKLTLSLFEKSVLLMMKGLDRLFRALALKCAKPS